MAFTPDTRSYRAFEIRAAHNDGEASSYRVRGYAATFGDETVLYSYDGVDYKEVIDSGAFAGAQMTDVVMNYNHGGKPVARTKNGTLTLTVDEKGLLVDADLSGTEEGRRLFEEIRGGYIDKMSFAFKVRAQEYDRKTHTRKLTAIERVFDVAAVDIPAYESTSIAARSWAKAEAERETAEAERNRRKQKIKIQTMIGGKNE